MIRESGGDRMQVTAGSKVISDFLIFKSLQKQGSNFLDKMIHLIEGAKRQKTPNEIALNIVFGRSDINFSGYCDFNKIF